MKEHSNPYIKKLPKSELIEIVNSEGIFGECTKYRAKRALNTIATTIRTELVNIIALPEHILCYTAVKSYNNDGTEWHKFSVYTKAHGDFVTGSSKQGTKEEIQEYIEGVIKKRDGSIQCHDKSSTRRHKLKRVKSISIN